jgi:hypothetical protein
MTTGDERATIVARARRELDTLGELRPLKPGSLHLGLPDSVQAAILEDLANGNYARAARETTGDDPDMSDS